MLMALDDPRKTETESSFVEQKVSKIEKAKTDVKTKAEKKE